MVAQGHLAETARALGGLAQGGVFNEMAARRAFSRSLGKFQPQVIEKPVAVMSAFLDDRPLMLNRRMNMELVKDLQHLGLGFYPVKGAGQEEKRRFFGWIRYVVPSNEESFIVQPRGDMSEEDFEIAIVGLLQKFGQFGAMMKLPSTREAFILAANRDRKKEGSEAGATTVQDRFYTQLRAGPRATPSMLRLWEVYGERKPVRRFINWWNGRAFMNYPLDPTMVGRRFSIRKSLQLRDEV